MQIWQDEIQILRINKTQIVMKKTFLFTTLVFFTYLLFVPICTTAQSNTFDEGVVINGVKWATRNVDNSGTFTANPEDVGMFYQWNSKIGWSSTDPMISTNDEATWKILTPPTNNHWKKNNDPSPTGWRVPTLNEIKKLLDINKVSHEWTTVNDIGGMKFTDITTGNSIFLPAAGLRYPNKSLSYVMPGNYWSSTQNTGSTSYEFYLGFGYGFAKWYNMDCCCGFSVRSVAE